MRYARELLFRIDDFLQEKIVLGRGDFIVPMEQLKSPLPNHVTGDVKNRGKKDNGKGKDESIDHRWRGDRT
jgi:hypothetical protein